MSPRIIIYDLECLPDFKRAAHHWPRMSDYPGKTLKAEINSVLSIAWKVFGQSKVHCLKLWDYDHWTDEKGIKFERNYDKPLLEDWAEVIKDCDAVVTHNGKRFDEKFIDTRMILNGMKFTPKVKHNDTYQLARQNMTLSSNSLKNLCAALNVPTPKMDSGGWGLWERIVIGEHTQKDLAHMAKYNKTDVLATEGCYKVLRSRSKQVPNHNLWIIGDKNVCPICESTRLRGNGYRHSTQAGLYQRFNCVDCGAWPRKMANGGMRA